MTQTPDDDEARHRMDALAGIVRSELAAAGLPVIPEDHPLGTAGALVMVDRPFLRGVLVDWAEHALLVDAGLGALGDDPFHEGAETAALTGLQKVIGDAMQEAMEKILTAAGLEVTRTDHDHTPGQLLVTRRVTVSPWRAWHDAQFVRRYDTMRAAWNERNQAQRTAQDE